MTLKDENFDPKTQILNLQTKFWTLKTQIQTNSDLKPQISTNFDPNSQILNLQTKFWTLKNPNFDNFRPQNPNFDLKRPKFRPISTLTLKFVDNIKMSPFKRPKCCPNDI